MTCSGCCLHDPQFLHLGLLLPETNEFPCTYNSSGEYFSSDALPPDPASDLGDFFAPETTMYSGSITSFFRGSSWDWPEERYDRGAELPYKDYGNWICGDDSHFSTCWEDYFPRFNDGFTGSNHLNDRQRTGDMPQSEDQIDDANMTGETTPASHSYQDAASVYECWLEQLWEEHYARDQWKDPRSYSDDYGFCSDIFGYWPCMLERDPGDSW